MIRIVKACVELFRQAWYWFELIRDDRSGRRAYGFRFRPGWLARGFMSESVVIYEDFAKVSPVPHLKDIERLRSHRPNDAAAVICNDKILFERVFGRLLHVPTNLALVERGRVRSLVDAWGMRREVPLELLLEQAPNGLVAKPLTGGGGKGIVMIRPDGERLLVNGEPSSRGAIDALLARMDRMLLVPFVRQGAWSSSLWPGSTNTIRVLTMIDARDGEPFVARAIQRIGGPGTGSVDNWGQGGLGCHIDIETGELSAGVAFPRDGRVVWHEVHPGSGCRLAGNRVPHWKAICEGLLRAVGHFPMLPYVGWDVIVTDDGFSVIEGNARSGMRFFQTPRPLLMDERIRRFYIERGVLSKRRARQVEAWIRANEPA